MSKEESHLTEAQKQVLRLEQLRAQKEDTSKTSAEKTYFPHKTTAEQSIKKLKSMREKAKKPGNKKIIDGKFKTAKLNALQIQILERLKAQDRRLNAAAITRIALNRLLDIENSFDENELEARVFEILRQFNTRS